MDDFELPTVPPVPSPMTMAGFVAHAAQIAVTLGRARFFVYRETRRLWRAYMSWYVIHGAEEEAGERHRALVSVLT